jgi:GGDEF domain-containing protein
MAAKNLWCYCRKSISRTRVISAKRYAAVREQNIPHERSDVASCVTVSVGAGSIADLPELAASLSRKGTLPSASMSGTTVLVEMADHGLYEAKVAGRNRVVAAGVREESAASMASATGRQVPSAV